MALKVAAPVREALDLAAQATDRERQLHAVVLDRAADLRGRAPRHQPAPSSAPLDPAAVYEATASRTEAPGSVGAAAEAAAAPIALSLTPAASSPLTVSRILRASSIAMFGSGGAPFFTTLAAISPATMPSKSSPAA